MNRRELWWRGLWHHWRSHLGVLLGLAVASTVLVGALTVGESVRGTLRNQALERIGQLDGAVVTPGRFFQESLASRVASATGYRTAAALQLPGVMSAAGGARTALIDVVGADARFFAMAPGGGEGMAVAPGAVAISERLADQLAVEAGATVVLRVEKPSLLPRDTAIATLDDAAFALRVPVDSVWSAEQFGRFALHGGPAASSVAFVDFAWLQEQVSMAGRANFVAVAGEHGDVVVERTNTAIAEHWELADGELAVGVIGDHFELSTSRIFLDRPVVEAAARAAPGSLGLMTYFVDELRHGEATTPYSTVAGIGLLDPEAEPVDAYVRAALAAVGAPIGVEEIRVGQWLADDLGTAMGDLVEIDYTVLGNELELREATHPLRVSGVVARAGIAADATLMPPFPGLDGAEDCRDWEPGLPVDLERIREHDRAYWREWRGTPKAFVSLAFASEVWGNRFGTLTAVRGAAASAESFAASLRDRLDPATFGLVCRDVRGPALAAADPATDFGGLFLGLSFFLIVSALVLTGMLFGFGVEQRAREVGTLLALGYTPVQVRRGLVLEAAALGSVGVTVGSVLGLGYTSLVLDALGSVWSGATGGLLVEFHGSVGSIAGGALGAFFLGLFVVWRTARRLCRRPAVDLLRSRGEGVEDPDAEARRRVRSRWLAGVFGVLGLGAAGLGGADARGAAMAFYGAGSMLLLAAIFACRARLASAVRAGAVLGSVRELGIGNGRRRPARSLAAVASLAAGTFLVISVQAHQLEPPADVGDRASGTGGFALYGRSSLPVARDLGSAAGREHYGLDDADLADVAVVPLRVRGGDEASCLNLARPPQPRLLGVDPLALASRGAFTFAGSLDVPEGASPWTLLGENDDLEVVPAIGDQASVMWAMHKAVGDDLDYVDEQGRPFRVRIVGVVADSILQGSLLIARDRFEARYPSISGFSSFLIDAPAERVDAVSEELGRALGDLGLELTPTGRRLAEYQSVQNTYLLIFQVLGGLGLLLGTVGLGAVVLRNALERRREWAVLAAVGYARRDVRRLLWYEHGWLLALGLGTGALSGVVAVGPRLGGDLALGSTGVLLLVLAVSGAFWVWSATTVATRGSLWRGLRSE